MANPKRQYLLRRRAIALGCSVVAGLSTVYCNGDLTTPPHPPAKVAFTVQPTNAVAGAPIAPAMQITVQDAQGNTVTSSTASITVAIGTNPTAGTLSGTKTVAAVAGVATFSDVSIDKAGADYTLTATSGTLAGATSGSFTVSAGPASKVAFTVQPTSAAAGAPIAPAMQATVQDAQGNTVTSSTASITVAIGTNPTAGTLSGTKTVAAVAGVATFSDLSIDKAGPDYTLTATSGTLAGATSGSFTVSAGPASKVAFTVQPANAAAGVSVSPPVAVAIEDALGNLVLGATNPVTVAITTNPGGGALSGTTTVSAVNGVATFTDLAINRSGSGYLMAATSSGLASAVSTAFDISPGSAAALAFTTEPSNTTAGSALLPAVQVAIQDAWGNTVPTATSSITLAITSGTGTPGAVLSGTVTVAAVSGIATFADLKIDKSGSGYALTATAMGLTSATSSTLVIEAFVVAVGTGTRHSCALVTEGDVYCWGNNEYGSLGDGAGGPFVVSLTSVRVLGNLSARSVTVGALHNCLVTTNGEGYCWGYNSSGQLGDGTQTTRLAPERVIGGLNFASIAAGGSFTCGLTIGGALYCWGWVYGSTPTPVFNGVVFSSVHAGHNGACALTDTGAAYCFGSISQDSVAIRAMAFETISPGVYHACGITLSRDAYCWGSNYYGQLGNGSTVDSPSPVAVGGGLTFTAIFAAEFYSCGLATTGAEYCWGSTGLGRLGNGSEIGPDNCGYAYDPPRCSKTPLAVVGGLTFSSISPHGSYAHTCSTTAGGRAYCWGYNAWGQLGNGTFGDSPVPVLVVQPR